MDALIEVLDRDGQIRQSQGVTRWPLRVGRALDNDLVLSDPHVAAHHLHIDASDAGRLQLHVDDTRNGVQLGAKQRLQQGESAPLPALFAAAGAKFAFDPATLGELVGLMEREMDALRAAGG